MKLEIETTQQRPLGPKEIAVLERALNAQFTDATFRISSSQPSFFTSDNRLVENAKTAMLNDWERNALEQMATGVFYPKDEKHFRVKILKLRRKLPDTHVIITKRNEGYRLVKA